MFYPMSYAMEPDHKTVEEFMTALANAAEYNSHDTGLVITSYWRDEARVWLDKWERERNEHNENIRRMASPPVCEKCGCGGGSHENFCNQPIL